jgi:hypothetical protein
MLIFKLTTSLIFVLTIIIYKVDSFPLGEDNSGHNEYMHEWAVQVHDPEEADLIAMETGFQNKGPVCLRNID